MNLFMSVITSFPLFTKIIFQLLLIRIPMSEATESATCTKKFIRLLVVDACSYAKRGLEENNFLIETTNSELSRFFNEIAHHDYIDDYAEKTLKIKINTEENLHSVAPEDSKEEAEIFWASFLNSARSMFNSVVKRRRRSESLDRKWAPGGEIAGIPIAWLSEDEINGRKLDRSIVRRNIRKLVEKCCTSICTVDDFKDVCG